ncbi:MAG: hypothetical protein U0414_38800 [Polyangiaceae bacterium]
MRNRVFFPQTSLDEWIADDRVELAADELQIRPDGTSADPNTARRYRIVEAVRVLREVTDTPDPNDLVGKVKSKAYLAELGAEILESSMIIGDNAYDIVPGFAGAPIGSFAEHRQTQADKSVATDEELLAAFLMQTM